MVLTFPVKGAQCFVNEVGKTIALPVLTSTPYSDRVVPDEAVFRIRLLWVA